jgi:hypothetical protein
MGYELRAFIARFGTFETTQALSPCITVAPLNQGFELLYNDDLFETALESVNKLPEDGFSEPFPYSLLSATSVDWAIQLSRHQPIAYVVADYFGGAGSQQAIVWKDGQIVMMDAPQGIGGYPTTPENSFPINVALRALGVVRSATDDEFVELGLLQCQDREDWFRKFNRAPADANCKSIYDMDYEG